MKKRAIKAETEADSTTHQGGQISSQRAVIAKLSIPLTGVVHADGITYPPREFRAAARARRPLAPTISAIGGRSAKGLREEVHCTKNNLTTIIYSAADEAGGETLFQDPEQLADSLVRRVKAISQAIEESHSNNTPLSRSDELCLGHLSALAGKPGQSVKMTIGTVQVDINSLAESRSAHAFVRKEWDVSGVIYAFEAYSKVGANPVAGKTVVNVGFAKVRIPRQKLGQRKAKELTFSSHIVGVPESLRMAAIAALEDGQSRQIMIEVAEATPGKWASSGHTLIDIFPPDNSL